MAKSKIKVPKRVAGVKIPKAVRKGPVVEFVNSKAGRVLIGQALTAAIGVLAYKGASEETRDQIRGKAKKGVENARATLERNTARLSYAFGEAVTAFRTALGENGAQPEPGAASATTMESTGAAGERGGKKKKRTASSSLEQASPH
jgi:hypothetical protein